MALPMTDMAEIMCRACWWREGGACYNEALMAPGKVNKIPRKVEGDDRNGMEITDDMWRACKVTARFMPSLSPQSKKEFAK
jgi:hypothetical protein